MQNAQSPSSSCNLYFVICAFSSPMPAPKGKSTAAAPSNFAAVLGTDEVLVKDAALKLSREMAPADAGDFGADVIDGIAESAEHCERIVRSVMDALQTLPFFG